MAKYYLHPQDKIDTITRIYDELDVRTDTEAEIRKYYGMAMAALNELNVPEDRKHVLLQAAEHMMHRDH